MQVLVPKPGRGMRLCALTTSRWCHCHRSVATATPGAFPTKASALPSRMQPQNSVWHKLIWILVHVTRYKTSSGRYYWHFFKIPLEFRTSSLEYRRTRRPPSILAAKKEDLASPESAPFLFVQKEIQQTKSFPPSSFPLPPLGNWLEKQGWPGELPVFTENLCSTEYLCIWKIRLNLHRQIENSVAAGSRFHCPDRVQLSPLGLAELAATNGDKCDRVVLRSGPERKPTRGGRKKRVLQLNCASTALSPAHRVS